MPKKKNPLTPWASWAAILVIIFVIVAVVSIISSCSSPILQVVKEIVNPTFTAQIHTPKGPIDVKIPAELPDFVTGGKCCHFEVSKDFYGIKFRGVTKDSHGRLIDYYILVVKRGKPGKVIALRAVQMDTDRFWWYIKGEPVPSSQDQVRERIEGLIGRKIS